MKTVSIAALTGLFAAASVQGAEITDEIVVTATRTETAGIPIPAAISVINRNEIENSGARTLSELLRTRAGVHVSDLFGDGSNSTLDMRGFGATAVSNTLVMVDGRPLNNSSDIGTIDLSLIDLDNVERIEIVQGSAGALYGNQAVGGLINVVTRGISRQPELVVATGMASYDEQQLSARARHRFDSGLAFALRGRYRESDNYRDHNRTRLDNGGLRVEQNFSRGQVFVDYDYARENTQLPGALFADEVDADRRQSISNYSGDYSLTQTDAARVGFVLSLTDRWRLEAEATQRQNDREFINSFRFAAGTLSTQRRWVSTFNPRLHGQFACGTRPCEFTFGGDFEQTRYRLSTSFGPQYVDQFISGYYGQLIIPVASTVSATLGARHAAIKNDIFTGTTTELDDDFGVGSAGLSWKPGSAWRLFGRADQNFRFAKVDEHTNPVFGQPVGLHNQTGTSYEVGMESIQNRGVVRLTGYELKLENEIAFDSTGFSNINLPRTRRFGGILEANGRVTDRWSASVAYTWTDTRITDGPNQGNRIPLVPRAQARVAADWRLLADWSLRIEGQWVDRQTSGGDFANAFPELPSFAVANIRLGYTHDRLELALHVNNLFDREYSETGAVGSDAAFVTRDAYFPAPGRNLRLAARYAWR